MNDEEGKTRTAEPVSEPKIRPEAPASDKQRLLLKLAIAKDWLHPNPFTTENRDKWTNLTAGEADKLLSSIPPERLGVLEREAADRPNRTRFRGAAHAVGRGIDEFTRTIGQTIDGDM